MEEDGGTASDNEEVETNDGGESNNGDGGEGNGEEKLPEIKVQVRDVKKVTPEIKTQSEGEDDYLGEDGRKAVGEMIGNAIKPFTDAISTTQDESEIQSVLTQHPELKPRESAIRDYRKLHPTLVMDDIVKLVSTDIAIKQAGEKAVAAHIKANKGRGVGGNGRSLSGNGASFTPNKIDQMSDADFDKLTKNIASRS